MNKEITEILTARRMKAQRVANNYKNLLLSMPKVKELYQAELELIMQKARAEALDQPFDTLALSRAQHALDQVLCTIQFDRKNLSPAYTCPICQDTGYVNGHECQCVDALKTKLNLQKSGVGNLPGFEDIDYAMITTDSLKKIISALMQIAKSTTQKYRIVTLSGGTGGGKTFVLQCMANEYIKRSKNVLMSTAFQMNNDFLKLHTSNFESSPLPALEKYLDPYVLLIDDLGTEPTYRNVTKEYFYVLLNQRELEQKITLISTNLQPANIKDRYGERLFSRIVNKNQNLFLKFENDDIRLKKFPKTY